MKDISFEALWGFSEKLTGEIRGLRKFNVLVGPNGGGKTAILWALYYAANRLPNFEETGRRRDVRDLLGRPQPHQERADDDGGVCVRAGGWTLRVVGEAPRVERVALVDAANARTCLPPSAVRRITRAGALARQHWEHALCDAVARIFPDLSVLDVRIDDDPYAKDDDEAFAVKLEGEDDPTPVCWMSGGFNVAFRIAAFLAAMRETCSDETALALIDGVEGMLDPVTLDRTLDVIAEAVVNAPIQVVLATHSIETLAWTACAVENGVLPPDDVAVFFVERIGRTIKARPFPGREISGYMSFFGDIRLLKTDETTSLYRMCRLVKGEAQ